MTEPLSHVEVRILGALVEKALTTPDNYPLTLNSLTAACNQTTNRDPVMELDEVTVVAAVKALVARGFVREVYRSDSRAKRYRHALPEALNLHPAEIAVLCVLMLRGPQTPGEIRGRISRLHEFDDPGILDITLDALRTMPEPLVLQLPRQPGQKEARFAHLLAGEPEIPSVEERSAARPSGGSRIDALEADVASMRTELTELREKLDALLNELQ